VVDAMSERGTAGEPVRAWYAPVAPPHFAKEVASLRLTRCQQHCLEAQVAELPPERQCGEKRGKRRCPGEGRQKLAAAPGRDLRRVCRGGTAPLATALLGDRGLAGVPSRLPGTALALPVQLAPIGGFGVTPGIVRIVFGLHRCWQRLHAVLVVVRIACHLRSHVTFGHGQRWTLILIYFFVSGLPRVLASRVLASTPAAATATAVACLLRTPAAATSSAAAAFFGLAGLGRPSRF